MDANTLPFARAACGGWEDEPTGAGWSSYRNVHREGLALQSFVWGMT